MSENQDFKAIMTFSDSEIVDANRAVLNMIATAMFGFFSQFEGDVSSDELDEIYRDVGGVAAIAMSAAGMKIIGENISGDYVVHFKPYESFDDFAKKNGIR